jgi:hypothetical protein
LSADHREGLGTINVGRLILLLLLGAILWGLVKLFHFWPQARDAIRLLREMAATKEDRRTGQIVPGDNPTGTTFDEFKSFADRHGLNWEPRPENPNVVGNQVIRP